MPEKKKDPLAKWQALLNEVQSGGAGGNVFFLKSGKTYLRLLPLTPDQDDFWSETKTIYNGKERTRYMVLAQIMKTDQGDLSDRWINRAVPVLVPKQVFTGILNLLAEGFKIIGDDAFGIIIMKSGRGLSTSYSVMPSQKMVTVNRDDLQFPDETWAELAEGFYQQQLERDNNRNNSTDNSAIPTTTNEASLQTSNDTSDW